ncbi:MAG: ABC transporter permease [Acidimicrobiia bacterium]|nr:ABC transporter permease [Acidimicrobiia bacterium]
MRESFRQALTTLRANRLRSALGALAIAVAVATQVIVVAALDGVAASAESTTARAFGSETFLLGQVASPGRVSRRELQDQLLRNQPIRRTDWRFLEGVADGLVQYAPNVQAVANVTAGSRTYENAAVSGTTSVLANLRDLAIASGRFLVSQDDRSGAAVAVIGADVADTLFPASNPLGQGLRIAGRRFEVVGVQVRQGSSGGTSLDRFVWIPLAAWERAFGAPRTLPIFARALPGATAMQAEDRARASLRARRNQVPGEADAFDVLTPDAARGFVANLSRRIGVAAGPISLMALLAAIVVVTNTVLVSVTQRTREIGVRRALGATRTTILREVLAESALTAMIGGVVGLGVAWGMVTVLAGALDLPVAVAPMTVATSLLASALSGIVAGWYPARRATHLVIVDALRTE